MNRKQKIIVSVVGIFIVLLALVGITYAYFLTRIQGNTNTTSITVTTADLKLVYGDGDGAIEAINIEPGETIDTKTFTVYNDGNAKVVDYHVYLENVVNSFSEKKDVVYTLDCKILSTGDDCENLIEDERQYPSENGTLLTNSIDIGETHTYTLTIRYEETETDQSVDMNKRIGGKINIYDKNSINKLSLSSIVMTNQNIVETTKSVTYPHPYVADTNFSARAFTGEYEVETLNSTTDDYGTSYYFSGHARNNYVKFANLIWRIVRVNGDGSVRIVLDKSEISSAFNNSNILDNAYVGYMFGAAGSGDYPTTHANTNDSTIKTVVDTFYETYIESAANHFEGYLADTLFCGDKSVKTGDGIGQNITTYGNTVNLECAKGVNNNLSRYTSNLDSAESINDSILVNNDLKHPIALLSKEEVALAGCERGLDSIQQSACYNLNECIQNYPTACYLNNLTYTTSGSLTVPDFWTMTPSGLLQYGSSDYSSFVFMYTAYEGLKGVYPSGFTSYSAEVRPVVNLNTNVYIVSGDGMVDAPYELALRQN